MRREPGMYNAYAMLRSPEHLMSAQAEIEPGKWAPCRPLGGLLGRWRAAWLVFTGRCDVLIWPGQER